MSLIQILAIIFVVFTLWRVVAKYRRHELQRLEFLSWLFFWLAVGAAFLSPRALTRLANFLGIGRGADLVLYLAVLAVFYLMFRIFVRLEKMEREITKIIRQQAIRDRWDKLDK